MKIEIWFDKHEINEIALNKIILWIYLNLNLNFYLYLIFTFRFKKNLRYVEWTVHLRISQKKRLNYWDP